MKKILKPIAVLAIAMTVTTNLNAQKVAHISMDSLISIMPETKKAKEEADKHLKGLEATMTSMRTELETKYNDYMTNQATYSDLVKKTKEEEIQSLQQRSEEFRSQAQQDYQKKYTELSKPIYEKAKKAIDAVAKEAGYKYVLDTSTGIVLYSEPGDDILAQVKKKLDSMPEAVLPGTTVSASNDNKAPAKPTTPQKSSTPPAKGK